MDRTGRRSQCTSEYEGWRCQANDDHVGRGEKHRAGDLHLGGSNGAVWWRRFIDYDALR